MGVKTMSINFRLIINLGLILILIFSIAQLPFKELKITEEASASSTWTQSSYSDFSAGTLENLEILAGQYPMLCLGEEERFFKDD